MLHSSMRQPKWQLTDTCRGTNRALGKEHGASKSTFINTVIHVRIECPCHCKLTLLSDMYCKLLDCWEDVHSNQMKQVSCTALYKLEGVLEGGQLQALHLWQNSVKPYIVEMYIVPWSCTHCMPVYEQGFAPLQLLSTVPTTFALNAFAHPTASQTRAQTLSGMFKTFQNVRCVATAPLHSPELRVAPKVNLVRQAHIVKQSTTEAPDNSMAVYSGHTSG